MKVRMRRSTKAHREACFKSLQIGTILTPLFPQAQAQSKDPKKVIFKDEHFGLTARVMVSNLDGTLGKKNTISLPKLVNSYGWEGKPSKGLLSEKKKGIFHPDSNGGRLGARIRLLEARLSTIEEKLSSQTQA